MSYSTALAIEPGKTPLWLAEFRNAHGWSPSIWDRLLEHNYHHTGGWIFNGVGDFLLTKLWHSIDTLPDWQQVPLVLTFDTGVIPKQHLGWAAHQLDEFEARLPAKPGRANHVPEVAKLLRTLPECEFFGIHGTSVSENPFVRYLEEEPEGEPVGVGLDELYILEQHRGLK